MELEKHVDARLFYIREKGEKDHELYLKAKEDYMPKIIRDASWVLGLVRLAMLHPMSIGKKRTSDVRNADTDICYTFSWTSPMTLMAIMLLVVRFLMDIGGVRCQLTVVNVVNVMNSVL